MNLIPRTALVVAVAASIAFNVTQIFRNHALVSKIETLSRDINDPATGYVVRLTTASSNAEQCKATVDRQNVAIRTEATRSADALAAAKARYDSEHAARIAAEKAAAAFLAVRPQGATLGERIADVDSRVLGDLK